jgi:hypothetical protein
MKGLTIPVIFGCFFGILHILAAMVVDYFSIDYILIGYPVYLIMVMIGENMLWGNSWAIIILGTMFYFFVGYLIGKGVIKLKK